MWKPTYLSHTLGLGLLHHQWLIISVCKSQLQITTLLTQSITALLAGNIQLKTFREYNYHLFTLQIIRT